jgi:hypothetical protein
VRAASLSVNSLWFFKNNRVHSWFVLAPAASPDERGNQTPDPDSQGVCFFKKGFLELRILLVHNTFAFLAADFGLR